MNLPSFLLPFTTSLYAIGIFYATLVCYWAIMSLYRAKAEGKLSALLKVLGAPVFLVGLVLDAASNLIASVLMWHIPHEWLLTQKLERIQVEEPNGWRNKTAKFVCASILNPFAPGGHHC